MKIKRPSAFTLIELLVVISIIGILASLAIPAVTGALLRGQQTGTLSNGRQLHIATQSMELDNFTAGSLGGWPGSATNSVSSSVALWTAALTNGYLTPNDLKKVLTAPGKSPDATFSAATIAFNVYQVGNVEDSGVIFLSTANWDAVAHTAPTADAKPYGNKGFVVVRKGGDGQIYQNQFATNTNVYATNQPAKLN